MNIKRFIVLAFLLSGSASFAFSMQGSVSADYDLSFDSILKHKFGELVNFSKIFEKNDDIFYQKKYRPVYMLSMSELYSVEPTMKSNLEKRKIPNTYNLSFSNQEPSSSSKITFSNNNLDDNLLALGTLEKENNFETIQSKYIELIEKNPDRIELLYKYSQFLYKNEKYEDSIVVLQDIIEKDSSFVLASYTLGNIYFDLGEYKKAIKANISVIKKNPYCADAYFNIASALEKLHKFNLAIDYYQKCLALNANDEQAEKALQRLEQLTYSK